MSLTALEVRSHFAMAVVTRFIYGDEIGQEKEADVYFEAFDLGLQSFALGNPTLPFLFRDVAFLTRGWKDGFASGYEKSKARIRVEASSAAPNDLMNALEQTGKFEIDGYSLNTDEHGVWVTNPYGVDCALLPMTDDGCRRILRLVELTKDRRREWASI